MITKWVTAVAVAAVAVNCAGATGAAAELFTIKSSTFADGKIMPKKVANTKENGNNNPNCVGDNVSPAILVEQRAGRHQELRFSHD